MDCCNTKENKRNNEEVNMKGGKSMEIDKKTMLWIVIGLLVLATIFLTLKASSIGAVQSVASGVQAVASTASSGMVGGC